MLGNLRKSPKSCYTAGSSVVWCFSLSWTLEEKFHISAHQALLSISSLLYVLDILIVWFFVSPLDISIRLQGSSVPNAGRVEVLYAGIWGAISRRNWDINAATVACRQLGYQAGAEAALTNIVYGRVSGPVWLTNLQCSGNENNLMSCSHDVIGNKSRLQRRWDVASVICKNESLPNGNM